MKTQETEHSVDKVDDLVRTLEDFNSKSYFEANAQFFLIQSLPEIPENVRKSLVEHIEDSKNWYGRERNMIIKQFNTAALEAMGEHDNALAVALRSEDLERIKLIAEETSHMRDSVDNMIDQVRGAGRIYSIYNRSLEALKK